MTKKPTTSPLPASEEKSDEKETENPEMVKVEEMLF
jgi:hypothetical protein